MNSVVIYGPVAAGKLTVATKLKELTGYKLIDNHAILNPIAELFPFEDPRLNIIRSRIGRRLRLELFEEAAKAEVDFITTLTTMNENSFKFMREAGAAVEQHGGHMLFVQLLPTPEAIMSRVESASRKGSKIESKAHLQKWSAEKPMQFDTFPDVEHLVLDNTELSPEEAARQIARYYRLVR